MNYFKNLKIISKLTLVFTLLLLAVLSSYLAIFWYNAHQKTEATLIDVAGRNRMLSQRIAAMALMCNSDNREESEFAREELRKATALHEQSLQVLKTGGSAPGLAEDIILTPAPESIMPKIIEIEDFFNVFKQTIDTLRSESLYLATDKIYSLDPAETSQPGHVPNPTFVAALAEMKTLLKEGKLLTLDMELVKLYTLEAGKTKKTFIGILIVLLVLNAFVIGFTFLFLKRLFAPLRPLSKNIATLAEGQIPISLKLHNNDEIGEISDAVNRLTDNIASAVNFARDVGEGKLTTNVAVFGGQGHLSQALNKMRDNLHTAGEEDRKRNWTASGLAKFAEILRSSGDLKTLGDAIISNLVKYVQANQGSLFVVNDREAEGVHLELISCYAFDRKKFHEKKIQIGDGLVGQAYLERSTIYLKEVPKDYIKITSGLGEALPRCILIVPLNTNDETQGIIELATFKMLQDYEISFVEKLAEVIASTLSSAKINERTKRLLEDSQQQAEELKAQEEEMRQNMEELAATQEQMRRQVDDAGKIQHDLQVRANVFALTTILSEADLHGNILLVNDKLCEVSKYEREELAGKPHNIFRHPDMPKELFQAFWATLKRGQVFRGIIKNMAKDGTHYWIDATVVPVRGENGQVAKYIGAGYYINDDRIAEELYNRQIKKMNLAGVTLRNLKHAEVLSD